MYYIYIIDLILYYTGSGGWEWKDNRCQIQNIWLWLSHCFQLTGHWVDEGEIGESLWLNIYSVIRLSHWAPWFFCFVFFFPQMFLQL